MYSWNKCIAILRNQIPPTEFGMWIKPLQVVFEENSVKVFAPNLFVLNWVKKHYMGKIEESINTLTNKSSINIKLYVGSASDVCKKSFIDNNIQEKNIKSYYSNLNINIKKPNYNNYLSLNQKLCFDNFIEGDNNKVALHAIKYVISNKKSNIYLPLVLYGKSGVGKTHLLQSAYNEILIKNKSSSKNAIYLNADRVVNTIMNNKSSVSKHYQSFDTIIIDDIQYFYMYSDLQLAIRALLDNLISNDKKVILSCDKLPESCNINVAFSSRLDAGLKIELLEPSFDLAVEILIKKSKIHNIYLNRETAIWLVEKLGNNIRELEGALIRLSAYSKFEGREVNSILSKKFLLPVKNNSSFNKNFKNVSYIKIINQMIKDSPDITVKQIKSNSRKKSVSEKRQIAMAMIKKLTSLTLSEIGIIFGGRDHSTVSYACKIIDEKINNSKEFMDYWCQLKKNIVEKI